MTLKTAVLAPMPSASAATATIVKPGERRSRRAAKRASWMKVVIVLSERLAADGAERPRGLLANARVGGFQRFGERADGATIADGAECPGGLPPDTGSGIRQRADETVDRTAIADRAKRPGHLFADLGFRILQRLEERRNCLRRVERAKAPRRVLACDPRRAAERLGERFVRRRSDR